MSNKDTYKRKHRYLDNQINTLEKHNHYNRSLISSLKKKKLRLKDKMISDSRESARKNKYNLHELVKIVLIFPCRFSTIRYHLILQT